MKLNKIRRKIDSLDSKLLSLLSRRFVMAKNAKLIKAKLKLPIVDHKREKVIIERIKRRAKKLNLNQDFIVNIFGEIIKESRSVQR